MFLFSKDNVHETLVRIHVNPCAMYRIRSTDRSVQGTEIAVDEWEDCGLFPRRNVSGRVMHCISLSDCV